MAWLLRVLELGPSGGGRDVQPVPVRTRTALDSALALALCENGIFQEGEDLWVMLSIGHQLLATVSVEEIVPVEEDGLEGIAQGQCSSTESILRLRTMLGTEPVLSCMSVLHDSVYGAL